eukprot:TRINITY_DN4606_c0_g1_i6.p1 TRINITY_DN4606_c0_g1~~TRINITY_DN4606_c0_g1_i6.p1  ORF type:complete len:123 (+),score=33.84 TRINITY_DN4606_c0_g1_i6:274-642(+)
MGYCYSCATVSNALPFYPDNLPPYPFAFSDNPFDFGIYHNSSTSIFHYEIFKGIIQQLVEELEVPDGMTNFGKLVVTEPGLLFSSTDNGVLLVFGEGEDSHWRIKAIISSNSQSYGFGDSFV